MSDMPIKYFDKLPQWVKRKYSEYVKNCQLCKKPITCSEMEIHRIRRGFEGGKYTLCKINHPKQNCMFLCSDCHKLIHSKEPNCY